MFINHTVLTDVSCAVSHGPAVIWTYVTKTQTHDIIDDDRPVKITCQ